MTTIRNVKETRFAFIVSFSNGASHAIAKPSKGAADGWMDRGMAKTKEEANTIALTWI